MSFNANNSFNVLFIHFIVSSWRREVPVLPLYIQYELTELIIETSHLPTWTNNTSWWSEDNYNVIMIVINDYNVFFNTEIKSKESLSF